MKGSASLPMRRERAKTPAHPQTIAGLIRWGQKELQNLGSPEAKVTAERLLEEILGLERTAIYLSSDQKVSRKDAGLYCRLVKRRKLRIPLAYLLKKAYFWNETLEVGPGCLIP